METGIVVGEIAAIFRYPIKSMRGETLERVDLGWAGVAGDRRMALRRLDDDGAFPWLSAGRFPALVRYTPIRHGGEEPVPTHVLTPEGEELPVMGAALATAVGRRWGGPVQMMRMKHGVFDEASVSVITNATIGELGRLSARELDVRRFRPNLLIRAQDPVPFGEDDWVEGVLRFGTDGPAVAVTMRDERCSMVNLDPDSADTAPEVLRAIVRAHQNTAGVYATVVRRGRLEVGQPVLLDRLRRR
jgi:uncharacterized protein YcbX